jgi:arabinogalactan oligomer/maltooligosaccharide transport system substrate-binding protein
MTEEINPVMNKPIRLTGLLGALAIIVSACGGQGATTAPTGAAATGPAATTAVTANPFPTAPVSITMWTKEGEADGALQFAKKLAADYKALHANVTITIVNKDVEKLRQEFLSSSLATPPDLLWTVSDHIGPFTADAGSELIMPLDGVIDPATYVPAALGAVQANGKTWGVPISYGNQLMLYSNKDLAGDTIPPDFDTLIAKAKTLTNPATGTYGLVFNQTESFWLVPFLGAFGGSVFDASGKPTLNTDAMKSALNFMKQLKFTDKIMPNEADYNGADGLFKGGKAAFIINGDWTLGAYADAFKDKLGLGPIPKVPGGENGKPYVAGAFFMVGADVAKDADKLAVISDFVNWATNKDNQIAMVKAIKRLPGNAEAILDAVVTGDPLLNSAAEAAKLGVGTPTNLEMRCVFDRMTPAVKDTLKSADSDVNAIVAAMQTGAETDVAPGGKCGPA